MKMRFNHYEMPRHLDPRRVTHVASKLALCKDGDRGAIITQDLSIVNCPKCKEKMITLGLFK